MTEPAIEQQEVELNQVLEQVKDVLGYGRLKAARELLERALQQYPTAWGTISRRPCVWHKNSSMKVFL